MTALNQRQNMFIQNSTRNKGVGIPFIGLGELEEDDVSNPMKPSIMSFHLRGFPGVEIAVFKRTQIG